MHWSGLDYVFKRLCACVFSPFLTDHLYLPPAASCFPVMPQCWCQFSFCSLNILHEIMGLELHFFFPAACLSFSYLLYLFFFVHFLWLFLSGFLLMPPPPHPLSEEKLNLDDSEWEDIHVITGALKLFFRELPEPLVPYGFYTDIVETVSKWPASVLFSLPFKEQCTPLWS